MAVVTMRELLDSGVHFGHQTRRWNPKMKRFIFTERNGIYIIDIQQSLALIDNAYAFVKDTVSKGGHVLFVGTKKQAKDIVHESAKKINMPFVTERWLGGMLTNFNTVRKSVKKMQSIEKMLGDGSFDNITKKERLTLSRDRDKMDKVLGGIAQLGRVPAALFIVDIGHEHIALAEAKRLGIATFGVVDTNCDPNKVDFAIPGNDDATKSIAIIVNYIVAAIAEGLAERQAAKDDEIDEVGDDEKERKAARLEAEAQAEGGRGGRGRGAGGPGGGAGGGQRRRTTGGPGGNRGPGGGRR